MPESVVIVGAGIGGVSAAYYLAVHHGVRDVTLVDERDPLTLTSDKGTQGYRNWWPGPDDTMLRFVSHSIDLMEAAADECDNLFRLNRRGYLFATATETGATDLRETAARVSAFGMGAIREHTALSSYEPAPAEGYRGAPIGADLLVDAAAHAAFPFLPADTRAALHVRRAGWMNAPAMGSWMLKRAIGAGARFTRDRVTGIDTSGGRVRSVRLASGARIDTECVVLAAGPKLHDIAPTLGLALPLVHELHAKVTFADPLGVIPRAAPFVIWNDAVVIDGVTYPGGVHIRPFDGPRGNELYLIWTFHTEPMAPVWPPPFDAAYGDVCVRGAAALARGMEAYASRADRGITDGGYYCKTTDNRPLIGPLPVEGAFVIGALSGTGLMSSHGAGELLARHVMGASLPEYAGAFLPSRYDDASYHATVEGWGRLAGQL